VHVDRPIDLFCHRVDPAHDDDLGVVHQSVDPAELVQCVRNQGFRVSDDVMGVGQRGPAGPDDPVGDRLRHGLGTTLTFDGCAGVVHHQPGSLPGQVLRVCPADAAPDAGDYDDSVLQLPHAYSSHFAADPAHRTSCRG
jgi:hypothetical protein